MGTGIGKYCKRCGEQLNYDDGFEDGFCNRCYHIAKFETKKMSEKAFSKEEDENEHIKTHKKFLKLAEKQLEEDYKCGTLEVLKNPKLRKELLQKDNQVIKKNLTTEKQGEWREGLDNIDLMLAMLQSIENCTDEEVRNTAKAIREELDKVSQLLSERTEEAYKSGYLECKKDLIKLIENSKALVECFNPISVDIRDRQEGELEAYNNILSKLLRE